jgi:hypothetical protein
VRPIYLPCAMALPCAASLSCASPLPCRHLCRALAPLPCTARLPCSSLCRAPSSQTARQRLCSTPPLAPRSTAVRHVAPLPCVCTRQSDQMSFAVCIHTVETSVFFRFLLFFIIPCP